MKPLSFSHILKVKTLFMVLLFVFSVLSLYAQYQTAAIEVSPSVYEKANRIALEKRGYIPPIPFTTDGCSMIPDGDLKEACVIHDIEYWIGGEESDRSLADASLRNSIEEKEGKVLGYLLYIGVRIGGSNLYGFSFTPYRFGYGYGIGDERAFSPREGAQKQTPIYTAFLFLRR
jgi:hypothetical protein